MTLRCLLNAWRFTPARVTNRLARSFMASPGVPPYFSILLFIFCNSGCVNPERNKASSVTFISSRPLSPKSVFPIADYASNHNDELYSNPAETFRQIPSHFLIIWVMQGHYDNGWFRFAKVRSTLYWLTLSIDSCTNFAKTSLPSDRGKPLTFLQWFMSEFLTWFDMSASCFNGTINGNTWGGPDTWSAPSIDYPPPLSSESIDHSPRWLKIGNPILVFCKN